MPNSLSPNRSKSIPMPLSLMSKQIDSPFL